MAERRTPDLSSSRVPVHSALVQKSVTVITNVAGRLSFRMLGDFAPLGKRPAAKSWHAACNQSNAARQTPLQSGPKLSHLRPFLWVLFPYSAINRMLVRKRKPPKTWADRLTSVFGTTEWETAFYSTVAFRSLLDSTQQVESTRKSADHRVITNFFVKRLEQEFVAVSSPFSMHNSNGALMFLLFFAAANERSAKTGLKIANDIIGKLNFT